MPSGNRKSIAKARPTRQSRRVFGDVSNQSSNAAASKKKAIETIATTVVQPARRRSARLSNGNDSVVVTDITAAKSTTHTDVAVTGASTRSTRSSSRKGKAKRDDGAAATAGSSNKSNQSSSTRGRAKRNGNGDRDAATGSNRAVTQEVEAPVRTTRSRGNASSAVNDNNRPARASSRSATATAPQPEDDRNVSSRLTRSRSKGKSSGKGDTQKKESTKRAREEDDETGRKARKVPRRTRSQTSTKPPAHKNTDPSPDFLTTNDFRLRRVALGDQPFNASKFTLGIASIDLPNKDNVDQVPEYVTDIMQRLFEREKSTAPKAYMANQPAINTCMRSILVDWLVEVHKKFSLVPETLYLGVNILDRYLAEVPVERHKLQLVGVTSLWLASKYEEIHPVEVRDCIYICDRAYKSNEMLDMETEILLKLQYKLSVPTGYPFLLRFLYIANATSLQKHAAHYYMERMLQEYSYLKYRPSLIAASCVSLALNNPSIRRYEGIDEPLPGVPAVLIEYTGYDMSDIRSVADKVCGKVQNTHVTNMRRQLVAVKNKFSDKHHGRISVDFDGPSIGHIDEAYAHLSTLEIQPEC